MSKRIGTLEEAMFKNVLEKGHSRDCQKDHFNECDCHYEIIKDLYSFYSDEVRDLDLPNHYTEMAKKYDWLM